MQLFEPIWPDSPRSRCDVENQGQCLAYLESDSGADVASVGLDPADGDSPDVLALSDCWLGVRWPNQALSLSQR
jgi:hypothetical protein